MSTFVSHKDPDAVLDYQIDWTAWLSDDDAIVGVNWTLGAGLTKTAESFTSTSATVWVSGGVSGSRPLATCRITTVAGRIDDRSIEMIVRDR